MEALDAGGNGTENYHRLGAFPATKPGQRLFVRETFALCEPSEHSPKGVLYKADFKKRTYPRHREGSFRYLSPGNYQRMDDDTKWFRATQMPLDAVRIVLEVTDARAELLQSISEDDARAEAAWEWANASESRVNKAIRYTRWVNPKANVVSAVGCFAAYWDSLQGKPGFVSDDVQGWRANPWVSVTAYKRLLPENEWKEREQ